MRYLNGIAVLGLALAAGGCINPTSVVPPGGGDVTACGSVSTVNTGGGLTPSFSWVPDCGVGILSIHPTDDTTSLWTVSNIDNTMVSPIRYGTPPENGSQDSVAVPLETGKAYRLRLGRFHINNTDVEPTIIILWLDTFVR